jgi:hypothetical protein
MTMPRWRRLRRPDLSGQRNTVVLQSGYGEGPFYELYPHMLIEDVGLRVMPLGTRWTEQDFAVELVPASERFEEMLAEALEPEGREGLTDAACHFIRETAPLAMHDGRAIYEIVYLRDESGAVAALDFAYVPSRSVSFDGDEYLQRVPEDLAKQWNVPTEIRGSARDLMVFEPPIKASTIQRMLLALAEVGRAQLPDFVEKQMLGEENVGYSPTEEIRFKDLALAEVSRDLGWDMRAAFTGNETFLEYYTIVRRFRFERFLARFRQRIIDQLNTYLSGIGAIVGESGQLVVRGLPTEADIDAAEISLRSGDRDFKDILEPFSVR